MFVFGVADAPGLLGENREDLVLTSPPTSESEDGKLYQRTQSRGCCFEPMTALLLCSGFNHYLHEIKIGKA